MKKVIVPVLVAAVLISACKKDSANNNCTKTAANIAGTYSIVKIEAGVGGSYSDVTTSQLEPCQLDDKLILNANGTLNYSDAGTKCDPDGSDTGTWSVTSDGKMTITGSGSTDVSNAEITSFDCTTLVITGSESILGTTIQYRLTVKK